MGRRPSKPLTLNPNKEGLPQPPDWLDDIAKAEWNRLGSLLVEAGLMTGADYGALTVYCVNWSRFVRNEKLCQQTGETYKAEGSEYPIYATQLNISNASQKMVVSMLKEFGLSPAARQSLKIEKKSPAENLVKFLTSKGKPSGADAA